MDASTPSRKSRIPGLDAYRRGQAAMAAAEVEPQPFTVVDHAPATGWTEPSGTGSTDRAASPAAVAPAAASTDQPLSLKKAATEDEIVLVPMLRPAAMRIYLLCVVAGMVVALLTKSPVGA